MDEGWRRPLSRLVGGLDDALTVAWLQTKLRHGWLDPVKLLPYRGWGTSERWHVSGRVVEARGLSRSAEDDPTWRNVVAAVRRFASSEIPGAVVRAHHDGRAIEAVTDVEGFYDFRLDSPPADGWQDVDLELVGPLTDGQSPERTMGEVLVPPAGAEFAVISDLDDTVLRSGITEALTAVQLVLFHNAHTRLPFPGVSAFYRALHRGSDGNHANPVFYVSGSPWNLYDLLVQFLDLHEVPKGPLFLKDWGIDEGKLWKRDTQAYKLEHINRLLEAYPRLDFVLIGDSGQHDPEIYAEAVRRHPGRIRAIYIRDVTPDTRDREVRAVAAELNVPMVLSETTLPAAEHAAEHGLIAASRLAEIRHARSEDL